MSSAATATSGLSQPNYLELNKGSEKYTAVSSIVDGTWRSDKIGEGADSRGLSAQNYSEITIKRVFEVNNPYLTEAYQQKRETMSVNPANMPRNIATKGVRGAACLDTRLQSNECYLFHGTQLKNIEAIIATGFKVSPNGMYGGGSYFAERSSKSDQYADDERHRVGPGQPLYMLVVRVNLGNVYNYTGGRELPNRATLQAQGYNSIIGTHHPERNGDKLLYREFVVFDGQQCLPAFLVEYERKSDRLSRQKINLILNIHGTPKLITVLQDITIAQLFKQIIKDNILQECTSGADFSLQYHGKSLQYNDSKTLAFYEIPDGATLIVAFRLPGG